MTTLDDIRKAEDVIDWLKTQGYVICSPTKMYGDVQGYEPIIETSVALAKDYAGVKTEEIAPRFRLPILTEPRSDYRDWDYQNRIDGIDDKASEDASDEQ